LRRAWSPSAPGAGTRSSCIATHNRECACSASAVAHISSPMDRSTRLEVLASVPVGRDPLGNTCCRVPAPSAGAKRRDSPARHVPLRLDPGRAHLPADPSSSVLALTLSSPRRGSPGRAAVRFSAENRLIHGSRQDLDLIARHQMDRYPALARSVRVQRLRTARTVGRRTRYRAQASSARPITVRICCSDHRVCLETGFATAPPTLPGRPARADSPSAVTNDESFDTFESFVFDAIACSYPRRPASNQGSAPFCEEKDRVERAKEDDRE